MTSEGGPARPDPGSGDVHPGDRDRPLPMTVAVGASMYDVEVVRLNDGRLGFVAPAGWPDTTTAVGLTGPDSDPDLEPGRRGSAALVRSGPAYEEVRGRLRAVGGIIRRWRLRRDRPVALVTLAGDEPAAPSQANRPSAR